MFLGGTLRVRYKLLVLVAWSILVCLALVGSGGRVGLLPLIIFQKIKTSSQGLTSCRHPSHGAGVTLSFLFRL